MPAAILQEAFFPTDAQQQSFLFQLQCSAEVHALQPKSCVAACLDLDSSAGTDSVFTRRQSSISFKMQFLHPACMPCSTKLHPARRL